MYLICLLAKHSHRCFSKRERKNLEFTGGTAQNFRLHQSFPPIHPLFSLFGSQTLQKKLGWRRSEKPMNNYYYEYITLPSIVLRRQNAPFSFVIRVHCAQLTSLTDWLVLWGRGFASRGKVVPFTPTWIFCSTRKGCKLERRRRTPHHVMKWREKNGCFFLFFVFFFFFALVGEFSAPMNTWSWSHRIEIWRSLTFFPGPFFN